MAARKELDFFSNIVVIDNEGRANHVSCTHSETAENVTFEATTAVELPALCLHGSRKPFTLYAFAIHQEEINQIVEQVIIKFGQSGVNEEVGLRLTKMENLATASEQIRRFSFLLEPI